MAQIFSPGTNTFSRVTLAVLLVLLAGAAWFALAIQRSAWASNQDVTVVQPIQFSHERHVGGNGLDCRYCHTSVDKSAFAGMPPTQTCMNCHSQIFVKAEYLEPVRESWRSGSPLQWRRVYNLPDHVFFNHSAHVLNGIGCSSCHGRVDRMPLIRQAVSLHMEWCLNCHREPERYVRPRALVYSMTYEPPLDQARQGRALVQEYGIRSLVDCYVCHR